MNRSAFPKIIKLFLCSCQLSMFYPDRKLDVLQENLSSGFPTRSDTNWAVQPQKMARGFDFVFKNQRVCTIYVVKAIADLHLCSAYAKKLVFS